MEHPNRANGEIGHHVKDLGQYVQGGCATMASIGRCGWSIRRRTRVDWDVLLVEYVQVGLEEARQFQVER